MRHNVLPRIISVFGHPDPRRGSSESSDEGLRLFAAVTPNTRPDDEQEDNAEEDEREECLLALLLR